MTEQLANPIAPLWTMVAIIVAVVIVACLAEWLGERDDVQGLIDGRRDRARAQTRDA